MDLLAQINEADPEAYRTVVQTEPDQTMVDKWRAETINRMALAVHRGNRRWWVDLDTEAPIDRNVGELLMPIVSELSEALEGHRKGLMDDKLPHRKMFEVELADAMIRIMDTAHGLGFDLGNAFVEKMEYNRTRIDHTKEARQAEGGKKY